MAWTTVIYSITVCITIFSENYDRRIRPYDKRDRLNVSINIYVSSFDSIEETSMDYRITFFLVSLFILPLIDKYLKIYAR